MYPLQHQRLQWVGVTAYDASPVDRALAQDMCRECAEDMFEEDVAQ